MLKKVQGPMIGYDEVRICPVCGKDVLGVGEVKCGDHFKGYSFSDPRRIPIFVTII